MNAVPLACPFPFFQVRLWLETRDPLLRSWLPWLHFPLLVQQRSSTDEFVLRLHDAGFPVDFAETPHSRQTPTLTQEYLGQLIWLTLL